MEVKRMHCGNAVAVASPYRLECTQPRPPACDKTRIGLPKRNDENRAPYLIRPFYESISVL
jgi:hypothetical protein